LKKFNTLFGMLSLMICMNLFAATRYVSDEIFIYVHTGPSADYRIIGTLKVGAPVTTLKYDSDAKFMQIKTADEKIGWVKSEQLQGTLPAQSLLPKVQQELQVAQTKLDTIAQENEQILQEKTASMSERENLITTMEEEKRLLQLAIDDLTEKNLELDLLQGVKDERIKMEWMLYGGCVLFFGLVVGLILPFLPRRKKNKNNW